MGRACWETTPSLEVALASSGPERYIGEKSKRRAEHTASVTINAPVRQIYASLLALSRWVILARRLVQGNGSKPIFAKISSAFRRGFPPHPQVL